MTVSYWLDQSTGQKKSADIIIIGAGLAGIASAYWLLKEDPSLHITLIEKDRVGFGASGRNAGFITCGSVEHFNRLVQKHGKDEALDIWNFSEENLRLLKQEIIGDQERELEFETNGSFSLASTPEEIVELNKSADLMNELGIAVEKISESEVNQRLNSVGFLGGVKYLSDAAIHPVKLLNAMLKRVRALGKNFELLEYNEVHRLATLGENKIVVTDQWQVEAPMVVMATNGFSPNIHPFFKDKIFPTRGQILVTEPIEKKFMEGPCYCNFVLDYFRQTATGEMLIGGFRQLQKEQETGYSDHVSDEIQLALEDFLQKHIPFVRGKKITHRWSGVMGFSVDGQPMVGSLPTDPQIFFVGGFTAHGIGLAFHAGKILADGVFGRQIPAFISAKRF